jgi:hypothetical protein
MRSTNANLLDVEDLNLEVKTATRGYPPCREAPLAVAFMRGDLELAHLQLHTSFRFGVSGLHCCAEYRARRRQEKVIGGMDIIV